MDQELSVGDFPDVLSANLYIRELGYEFKNVRNVEPVEGYHRYVVKFASPLADRELWVGLSWQNDQVSAARFSVSFLNTSRNSFDALRDLIPLEDYLLQCKGVTITSGFMLNDYGGPFSQRITEFVRFMTHLLREHADSILRGDDWPTVSLDP